jgi:hypothetical protein
VTYKSFQEYNDTRLREIKRVCRQNMPDNLGFNLQCDVDLVGAASAKKCMLRQFWLVLDELQWETTQTALLVILSSD